MTNQTNLVRNSSVKRAINVIGDYWVMLIMGEALLGSHRYSEFFESLDITHATLSNRLKRLVAAGLLVKIIGASENGHKKYHLTEKGRHMFQVLLVIWDWEVHSMEPDSKMGSSTKITHKLCGRQTRPTLICTHCGELIHSRDVHSENGPGAGEEPAAAIRMQRQAVPSGLKKTLITRALTIVGDRWASIILAASFRGSRRFEEYRLLLKISPQILSQRLSMLVELRMLERRVYQQAPNRYEYRLTKKAIDFYPVIVSLMTWGDRWLAGEEGPPIILHHEICGKQLAPLLTCCYCHEGIELDEIHAHTE
jgi:DNA-binding HxlR family transcriptional regulator